MKPKKIKIDFNTPIERWADANKGVIMDSIYENVFEFMDSDEDDRIILQVQPVKEQERMIKGSVRKLNIESPINVDFIISKDDIQLTLKKLLEHYVEIEEYEKCAEIVKLQNRDDSPQPKKRGRKKVIEK
jgi:hypothetical protein